MPSSRMDLGTIGSPAGSNSLYTRVVPSHAVELTSVYLDRTVSKALLERHHPAFVTLETKTGVGRGDPFMRRGRRGCVRTALE